MKLLMITLANFVVFCAFFSTSISLSNAQSAAQAYTPSIGACPPDFNLVRVTGTTNQDLSKGESDYISARREQVLPGAWKSYLATVQGTGATLPAYITDILSGNNKETPILGIAQSGGGLRAAIVGAGE
jgi:lysophospholipase